MAPKHDLDVVREGRPQPFPDSRPTRPSAPAQWGGIGLENCTVPEVADKLSFLGFVVVRNVPFVLADGMTADLDDGSLAGTIYGEIAGQHAGSAPGEALPRATRQACGFQRRFTGILSGACA